MIKAVIFDLDDTLLKTKQCKYQAIKHAGTKFYGQTITDKSITHHWGKPFVQFMELVYGNVEDVDQIIAKYKSIVQQFKNEAYPDTLPVLLALFPLYKVCILSSAAQSLVVYDLETAGLPVVQFTYIQSAEDTNVHKPDPQVFAPTIDVLSPHHIVPTEMLYVGDMISDFQAATGARLQFRGIIDRSTSQVEFEQAGAKTIASLTELPELIPEL